MSICAIGFCSQGTKIGFAQTTHTIKFEAVSDPKGLLTLPDERIVELQISPEVRELENGG
jgi:hypothetical protein